MKKEPLEIQIHHEPPIHSYDPLKDQFFVEEIFKDCHVVYLVRGETFKQIAKYDGFPLFKSRVDKRDQYQLALQIAVEWCELLDIDISLIKKVEFRDSFACKKYRREYKERIESKRKALQEELAKLG